MVQRMTQNSMQYIFTSTLCAKMETGSSNESEIYAECYIRNFCRVFIFVETESRCRGVRTEQQLTHYQPVKG